MTEAYFDIKALLAIGMRSSLDGNSIAFAKSTSQRIYPKQCSPLGDSGLGRLRYQGGGGAGIFLFRWYEKKLVL